MCDSSNWERLWVKCSISRELIWQTSLFGFSSMQHPACNRQPQLGPAVPDKHYKGDGCVPITLYSLIFHMALGLQDLTRSWPIKLFTHAINLKLFFQCFSFIVLYKPRHRKKLFAFFSINCSTCKGLILFGLVSVFWPHTMPDSLLCCAQFQSHDAP